MSSTLLLPGVGHATETALQSLTEFRQNLFEAQEPLGTLVAEIDDSAVQQWLADTQADTAEAKLANESLPEEERALWLEVARNENTGIERLDGALERAALARSYAERLQQAEAQLLEMVERITLAEKGAEQRSLSQIEAEIRALKTRQSLLRSDQEQKRQALQRLEVQSQAQHTTLETLRRQLDELTQPAMEDPPAPLHEAEQALQLSQRRLAEARMLAVQLDQQVLPARITLLKLELGAFEHENRLLNQYLQQVEGEFQMRSSEELRQLGTALRRLEEREPEAAVRFETAIQSLRSRIDHIATLNERIRALQDDFARHTDQEARLTQSLRSVRERLEVSGLSEALGVQFLDEQKRLSEFKDLRLTIHQLERELTQSRLRGISLRDELRELHAEPQVIADDPALSELQQIRTRVVTAQQQGEVQLADQIRQNELVLQAIIRLVDELDQILRETLLWWPSHTPVSMDWLMLLPKAFTLLFNAAAWHDITRAIIEATLGRPIASILLLLFTALLWIWGKGVPEHLERIAGLTTHRYTDRLGLTFMAIGWTLIRALPIPVLLLAMSFRLEQMVDAGLAAEVLANALYNVAIWWLAAHLLLLFTARNGVGTVHFEWNPLLMQRMRRHLTWFMPTQLLLILLLALTFGHPDELVYDVFGRLSLLLVVGLIALITWRLLAPADSRHGAFFQSRRRRLLRLSLTGLFAVLMLLILNGYLLTVGELLPRMADTLVMLSLVWVLYCIAARGLILSETRLRTARRREQLARLETDDVGSGAGAEGGVELPDPHLSIENINLQTRTLLRTAAMGGLLIALFWVWADVLPALTWLDGIQLWARTIMVGETEIIDVVTLQDLLLALLLGGVLALATKNLPGLVEIMLAHNPLVDATHSYTITMLLRYALVVIAVITVFSLLGLRWNELQWMVAALTLGLGFGLQEVVANFVSGVIMLFERPVRVGDTISIGEYSGTVARIRTRATTIIDWDNREVVVPNKTFITERLINWTLSDTITRLIIPVGVSYDSDPEQVLEILMRIASEHPLALKEPEPSVYFVQFADSSLNFELRVYVSQMKERLVTKSELLVAILKAFRAAGIEIAFPQMDLHIRDLPLDRAIVR